MREDFYAHLKEGSRPIMDGKNRIYYCELNQYYSDNVFRNFSIKFTMEGVVQYRTEKEKYALTPNYFLLSSKQPCECIVDSKPLMRNISIDIDPVTFGEVFTWMSSGKDIDLENFRAEHFSSPDFFENVYPIRYSELGNHLLSLGQSIVAGESLNYNITEETFYELAEKIVRQEFNHLNFLHQLQAVKRSTREETLRRLLIGKHYIDEHYLQNPEIPDIARQASLSQFYFFRNFKMAFGITPYQYMMHKRLEHAKNLIKNNVPVSKIASDCHYPDVFTFSKAFKKKYGYAPSMLMKTSNA
ncbi:MAG: helix-turn-helix transcriptional regulator [Saprospiraceae bacterium]|uniref:Helix-turn-helix transcriptional regulator n=1 Tax=Candidatus Opimibacter skivensis TaxID=2982028 RepID=A0A9D7SWK9_9BACT|nr:helix-turn-helix transcriptional regulator [Candidatus Opimibacter skivensis]